MSHSTEMDKWSVDVTPVFWHYGQKFTFYVVGDELLLNFGVKFYMWSYKIAMATSCTSQCQDGDKVLKFCEWRCQRWKTSLLAVRDK